MFAYSSQHRHIEHVLPKRSAAASFGRDVKKGVAKRVDAATVVSIVGVGVVVIVAGVVVEDQSVRVVELLNR